MYKQHPTLQTSISKQGCQHKMFAYEMQVHSCTYTPSDSTIFKYILHSSKCIYSTFCAAKLLYNPPPLRGGRKEQTKNKKKRGGRGDATIIFAEMLLYMVAIPIKTLYQYNIYCQLIACFVINYCSDMFWPQFLLIFRGLASLLMKTVCV